MCPFEPTPSFSHSLSFFSRPSPTNRCRGVNRTFPPENGSEHSTMARRRPRRSPQRLTPLLLRAVCIWGVAVALLPREGLSSKQLGADCFESCGYKSGRCPAVCPTTTRISGQRLVYTSYNCCRQGWHPHGECKISDGCVGRHCCVKGKESTQNPDAQASSASSAEISTGQTNMADPTCTSGVVSQTGFVCSPASCGESDGSANCALRKGGDMCCSHKMLHSVGSCSLGPPPCVIEKSQRSKRTTPCPTAGFADASLELSASLLQS